MLTIGIDPGATGAVALLIDDHLTAVLDMPYDDGQVIAPRLAEILNAGVRRTAMVERAQAMPGQGSASTFKYGVGYGVILGVLGALNIPYETIHPSTWKRAMGLNGKDKDASRRMASELWPTHAASFARKRDDGRAEAALIGLYALRRHTMSS